MMNNIKTDGRPSISSLLKIIYPILVGITSD
jgi:hypothetical protein